MRVYAKQRPLNARRGKTEIGMRSNGMRYLHSRQFRSEAGELRLPIMNVSSELLRLCQELLQRHLVVAIPIKTSPINAMQCIIIIIR